LFVGASARRSAPKSSPPRAYLPRGYPYGWGMGPPTLIEPVDEPKKEKEAKEVKRGMCLTWDFMLVELV